eukprot:Seg2891.2 transcript_id=Seg2891.2/GoldUCD/mRNA.D3Y31 product="Adenosine receptor A2b" protein_id=Seg2891.2/GoldUCD/D3Y31
MTAHDNEASIITTTMILNRNLVITDLYLASFVMRKYRSIAIAINMKNDVYANKQAENKTAFWYLQFVLSLSKVSMENIIGKTTAPNPMSDRLMSITK